MPEPNEREDWSATLEVHSVPGSPVLLVLYIMRDATKRVVEKGVITIWPTWNDARDMGVVVASRLTHGMAETTDSWRFEVTGRREDFNPMEFARKMLNTRTLFMRTLLEEGPPTMYLPKEEVKNE